MSNDLVPSSPSEKRPKVPAISLDPGAVKPLLALDVPPEKYQEHLVRAMDDIHLKSKSVVGKRFTLVGCCIYVEDEIDQNTGEMVPKRKVVLICNDGTLIAGANGFYKSLVRRINAGMGPPWPGGLEVEIGMRPTPVGDTTYLKVIADEEPKKRKG